MMKRAVLFEFLNLLSNLTGVTMSANVACALRTVPMKFNCQHEFSGVLV